ncbi:MAG: DEAD/DEAH box helicase, partial [Planctomycetales bacterium]|nr:DEAD/DEAH box helicase [Planctomycetales bacterium]
MPINPVQFAHSICDEFLRYIFSEFPLSDPQMESQAKALLKGSNSLDIPLVKGPFVSLSEAFAKGDSIQRLADEGTLHPVMPGLIGYPTMYLHQQEVLEAVRKKRHVLVSTGTGSGKTEAFLYPIVDQLLRERDQGITSGLSAILVYPMNALANDQLDRLRQMLGGTGVTFGQWVGPTPDTEAKVTIERFDGSSREAYLSAREQRLVEAQQDDRAVRPLAPPEECCSEEAIRNRKPRILVTNYRQLEILTTRLPDVQLFSGAPLKFLVFDEAHSYAGAVGAEVACLIRRLRMLAKKEPDDVVCIGTSATLADPTDPQAATEKIAGRFASRFFGVNEKNVTLVGESYVERDWPSTRYKPVFPHGDGMNRLSRILDAVTEPVKHDVVKSVVEELTGQIFEPGDDWRKSLFSHLLGNEYVYQSTEILRAPKRLSEAAWQTSQRVAMRRKEEGDDCSAELLCYLVLGAAARNGDESLLRPKVHFFLRGLDEMVVALGSNHHRNGTDEEASETRFDSDPVLYLSLADAKEGEGGGRRDDSFLPVLTCRNCGQHFFEQHFEDLEIVRGSNNRLRGFENGNAVQDESGRDNAVWATTPSETGTRMLMTNRLLEDAADSSTGRAARWPTVFVCRQCGALHRERSGGCLADGCGHGQPLVPLLAFGDGISSCPSCSSRTLAIGGRRIEPAKPIRAVTVADVHNLSQAMINAAPEGHKKLIVFADSRQDAAFQAGWMQDHARRVRMRHMMYEVLEKQSGPIELDAVVDGLMNVFRKDNSLIEALLPELSSEEAPVYFGHNKWVPVYKSLRYMVLREFTTSVRSTRWLEALGLAQVRYAGLNADRESVIRWAKLVGIRPTEAVDLISLILDGWRRSRMVHVATDPVYSQYHRKDDPYIQLGLLALSDFHPGGLDLYKPDTRSSVKTGLIASNGATAVQVLLRRIITDENTDIDEVASDLWDILKDDLGLVRKVGFQNTREQVIGEAYQIAHEKILVSTFGSRERCTTCQRVTTRKCHTSACVRYRCPGSTITEPADPENYDVWLMGRPFTMVSAEEHTAQVPGDTRTFIEQDFKSRAGRTNCLVATPTLEMGVNIGSLDMTLMRNVPPLASNYWQRAGRAGREERMAVIMTYCRRSVHDRYFFEDPLRILDGVIEAPSFNLKNPLMVAKHIRSAVLSTLLLKSRLDGELSERIRLVLKHLFPHFIRDYFLDSENLFRSGPLSTNPLRTLLSEMPDLSQQITSLLTKNWPIEAADLASEEFVAGVLADMPNDLTVVLTRLHNRLTWARNTRKELHRKKDEGIIEREEEQLLWRCDDYIRSVVKREAATYSLSVLGTEGFFPGYGVNDGGVVASARRGFSKGSGKRSFDLNRSNVIALREFVPGNRLYANRGSFYVSRYHLGTDEASRVRTLHVNA